MTTIQTIAHRLKTDWEYLTNTKHLGLIKSLSTVFATHLADYQDKLQFIIKNAFISTANETYLIMHGANHVLPLGALKARGEILCVGDVGEVLLIGTEFINNGTHYKLDSSIVIETLLFSATVTLNGAVAELIGEHRITSCSARVNGVVTEITAVHTTLLTIPAGDFVNGQIITIQVDCAIGNVTAQETGERGNLEFNTELENSVTTTTTSRVLEIGGGEFVESLEEYRLRVKFRLTNPIAPFNKNNVIDVVLGLRNIDACWVKLEGENVRIFAVNKTTSLREEEKDEITDVLLDILPANLHENVILRPKAPDLIYINIDISDFEPYVHSLTQAVKRNLLYAFKDYYFEKEVTRQAIESVIYNTTVDGMRVTSFTLNTDGIPAIDNTLSIVTNVSF